MDSGTVFQAENNNENNHKPCHSSQKVNENKNGKSEVSKSDPPLKVAPPPVSGIPDTKNIKTIVPQSGTVGDDQPQPPSSKTPTRQENIQVVFDHWRQIMNHKRAALDTKRKRLIVNAFGWGYSVQDLQQAIDGCAKTPHNMGDNDRGQRYDGLHMSDPG